VPLRISHRRQEDVPVPNAAGKVNEDLLAIKNEMGKLPSGMVLEIEAGSEKAIRGTKMLITKAANQLGSQWRHWHVGTKVFAKPVEGVRRRGRPRKSE
jgi:hypothetical protein